MRTLFKHIKYAGLLLTCLSAAATFGAQAGTPPIKNIVLVHGAFTDGSSWAGVIQRLQAKGYHVTAVQNPLTSLQDDVAATQRVLARQQGDVLLVGHSWAGAVIGEAGNASNVKGLVYLSALAPDSGESVTDLLHRLDAPMEGLSADKNGLIWLDDPRAFHHVMANDLSESQARLWSAVQQPIAALAFTQKIRHAAWHDKPTWYLLTTHDNALKPTIQERIAKEMGADLTRIPSGHMSMLSHPDDVAALIDKAALGINALHH